MTTELHRLLPLAHAAVDLGRHILQSRRPQILTTKGERDPVTELDIAIEHEVREFLAQRVPAISFLGEEEGLHDGSGSELTWALDPIDGTVNFMHGLPLCAVSLGLLRGSQPVLGVIDLPFLSRRYHGVTGGGAHLNGRPIFASGVKPLQDAVVTLGDHAVGCGAATLNQDRFAIATVASLIKSSRSKRPTRLT